jgi:hypothetical protein
MKGFICLVLFSVVLSSVKAQDVSGSLAEVSAKLCNTWELKYGVADSLKINLSGQGQHVFCTFKSDGSVSSVSGNDQRTEGNWYYDEKNHLISVTRNFNNIMDVISLKADVLVMRVNTENFTAEGPKKMLMFYSLKK